MPEYRGLDRWAAREQERFDREQLYPGAPGTEPSWHRAISGTLAVVAMITKLVMLPVLLALIARLVTERTLRSLMLAIALLGILGFSTFTTTYLVGARRKQGRNWLTGLAPRPTANEADDA